MSKHIILLGDPTSNPLVKGSITFRCGISLSSAPSSDVTVTIASLNSKFTVSTASMTFTAANWFTPQSLTITPVNDGIADCIYLDQLQLSSSGGGYSHSLNKKVSIVDVVAARNWIAKGYPVIHKEFTITSLSDVATKKQEMIDFWFNGNGIPSASPDEIVNNYTGTIHTADLNTYYTYANLKRIKWILKDEGNFDHVFYGYYFTPVTPLVGAPAIIFHEGHGVDNAKLVIKPLINAGYYVIHMGMPVEGDNTTTNPSVSNTLGDPADHNTLKNIASSTYDPIHLFVEPSLLASQYLATLGHTQKAMIGFSGGGSTNLAAIFDDTIVKIFYNRAFNWHSVALLDGALLSAFDYENFESTNSSTRFYNHMLDKQWGDLFLLCCANREVYIMNNGSETVAGYARYALAIEDELNAKAATVNGSITLIKDTDVSRATHNWYAVDATTIMNEL